MRLLLLGALLILAALVRISGHMGSRAIYHIESWAESRFVKRDWLAGDRHALRRHQLDRNEKSRPKAAWRA
jgi:hypothetical protein